MRLSTTIRRHVCCAHQKGLPFAIWRRPGNSVFEAAISCSGVSRRAVFGGADFQPFFAMAAFDAPEAGFCYAIAADVFLHDDTVRYHDGTRFQAGPASDVQRVLASQVDESPLRAPRNRESLPAEMGRSDYQALVERTVLTIKGGNCRKIVLSRAEARDLPADYDLLAQVEALAAAYPNAFVALATSEETGTWLVATPERLMSVNDGEISTMALAGTQWPQPGTELAAVEWPDKIVEEQRLVAEYIRDAFASCGVTDVDETKPYTVRAANLCHLRSDFRARLETGDMKAPAHLLRALHPTSAVCGTPKPEAMAFLRAHEGYDRSYYTGYLGPVGFEADAELFVNLRSAQVSQETLVLYVGGGIVSQSVPEVEWEETVRKTMTIADVLIPADCTTDVD